MSRQYQNPDYHSSHYQTSYSNRPQQPVHPTQPLPIPRDTYADHPSQHAVYPSYHEGSPQSQRSGPHHSPYAGPVPFLDPQGSPASHPHSYLPPSQSSPIFSSTHQQERQGPYGHPPPSTISPSDSHRFHPPGGSDTSGSSAFYSQPSYNVAQAARPPVTNASGYNEEHQFRPKGPGYRPTSTPRTAQCRFPRCSKPPFFDRRVNEMREWCSDEHMRAAIEQKIEDPCRTCGQWPRRNGSKLCSGNVCRYPGLPSQTTPNLAVGARQQEWQGAPGTGGGSNFYSNPGVQPHPGSHAVTEVQLQGSSATGYGEGLRDHGPQSRAPENHPVGSHRPECRYPNCRNEVFFDRRANRRSEWCNNHIGVAVAEGLEKPCRKCRVWPGRRNYAYEFCGGDICLYPHSI